MKAFQVPAIFSAIDKFTRPVQAMARSMDGFANKTQLAITKNERLFKKLTPSLSGAAREFLSFASTAAAAAAIISGLVFSFNSIKQYEDAIAKFRTIVSDLSDKDFAKFQNKINQVAKDTKESAITVANAFEMIAGLNAKLAETPEAIGDVTKATIVLSQASKDELGKSASNLVGIMNQFNLKANEANRVINVLAAGQAVGASSITQTADAFTVFGAVADASNLSLEQSVALTEVLASKQIMGAEAGTALRGTLIKLKAAGLGYKSGLFNTGDALSELKHKFDKLRTAKEKDALIDKVFGTINATTGTILLNNIALYDEFAKSVTGTSEAQKAAEINNNTLSKSLERLSNKWVNLLTSSDKTSAGLNLFTKGVIFLTDHMEEIITVGAGIIGFFIAWKLWIVLTKMALIGMRAISAAVFLVDMVKYIAMTRGLTFWQAAWAIVVETCTAAQVALNAAMLANPIGLIIIAIAAMIAVVVLAIKYWNEWGAVLALFLSPLGLIISLIQSFRRNWDMIKKAFSEGGILAGIKAIGATLLDAVLMPLQQILKIIAQVTGADWANNLVANMDEFRKSIGVNVETDESGNPLEKKVANPTQERQDAQVQRSESIEKQKLNIDINDKTGSASVKSSGGEIAGLKFKSTHSFGK